MKKIVLFLSLIGIHGIGMEFTMQAQHAPLPARSSLAQNLKPGIYQHFRGNYYSVVGVARYSEDPAYEYVVYQALYGTKELWVRPLAMFCEMVETADNKLVPRFTYIGDTV